MAASSVVYLAAGHIRQAGDDVCVACGLTGRGESFRDWVRGTFVDFDKLRPGEIVCDACEFCFTDRNPDLTRITGKDKPQRMRNYSHFVTGGCWSPVSQGDKPRMIALLTESPEVAVIADSGQKHIIFRARPGWWQFEELAIRPNEDALLELIGDMRLLLVAFSKAEIKTARYAAHRITQFGFAYWRTIESRLKQRRGGAIFELALFLAQKEANDGTSDDSGQSVEPPLEGDRFGVQAPLFT